MGDVLFTLALLFHFFSHPMEKGSGHCKPLLLLLLHVRAT